MDRNRKPLKRFLPDVRHTEEYARRYPDLGRNHPERDGWSADCYSDGNYGPDYGADADAAADECGAAVDRDARADAAGEGINHGTSR